MNLDATIVYQKNHNALQSDKRFIINQGSSRSSKTWSLCQLIIVWSLTNPNKTISIVRKTFPTLRATVISACLEGFRFVGMELDEDYFKIAEARVNSFEEYRKLLK